MRPSYSEKTDRADLDPEYRPLAPDPKCGKLQVIVQLQQLSDLGVAISIDDFGTGFSFLSYVKRLPVRALVCGRHIFGRHFPFRENARRVSRSFRHSGCGHGLIVRPRSPVSGVLFRGGGESPTFPSTIDCRSPLFTNSVSFTSFSTYRR